MIALPSTRSHAAIAAVLLAAWFVAFTGARPLNVPDEGRYAEVGREMLVTGDWVTPRLDGVPFLDKPPFFYWLEALSFSVFGVHAWSARLVPALLGLVGCLLVLVAGARLHGWRSGLLGAVVLAANPLYFGASLYVNHDLAVAVAIAGALLAFAMSARAAGPRRWAWLLGGAACAAVAVLTKGLIGVLFPFGIVGLWALALRRWDRLPGYALAGAAALLALAAPWFAAAQAANPDLLHYFFVVQHFQRFAGRGFNNPMGAGFYPALLAVGFLPWSPLLPAAWARGVAAFRGDRGDARADLLLLLWPAVVVAFFSIPESKIAGYVLPALPPLAMAVGRWWDEALGARADRSRPLLASGAVMTLFALALLAAPLVPAAGAVLPPRAVLKILVTGLAALAAALVALAAARRSRLVPAFTAHTAFAVAICAGLVLAVPDVVRDGTRPLAEALRPLLRDGDVVVNYRMYFYDLPLYLHRTEPVVVADDWTDPGIHKCDNWRRELLLGREWSPGSAAWLVQPEQLGQICAGGRRCFVLARREKLAEVESLLPLVRLAEHEATLLLGTPAASLPSAGHAR